MNPAIPFAVFLACALLLWAKGRRELEAEEAERRYWRTYALREIGERGTDMEHWV